MTALFSIPVALPYCALPFWADLSEEMAGQGLKIEGENGKLNIGLEGFEAGPGATVEAEGAFGGGDDAFDAGAPFAQALVHLYALDQFRELVAFEAGKCDILNAHGAGFFPVFLAGETAVGGDAFWGLAKAVLMALEGGNKLFGIGGVASFNAAIQDEVAFPPSENDFMPVDDFALPLLDDVGVLLENGQDFFIGRDRFAFDYAAFALRNDRFGQRYEMTEFADECEGEEGVFASKATPGLKFFDGLAPVGGGAPRKGYQLLVQFLPLLFASHVMEFVAEFFRGPGVVAEASMQAGRFSFDAAQNTGENPNRIPQLLRIDRVMDIAFNGAGVHPDFRAVLDFLLPRVTNDGIIDSFERCWAQLFYVLLQGGERGDFTKWNIAKFPQGDGIVDAIMQPAIAEPFAHFNNGEAQDLACGHSLRAGVLLERAIFLDAQIVPHHYGDIRVVLQNPGYFVPLFFARRLGMLKAERGLRIRKEAHLLTFLVVVSGISANLFLILVVYQKHHVLSRKKCT